MFAHFDPGYFIAAIVGAAVFHILFTRRDQFDEYADNKPWPSCYGSEPGPQERAENGCDDCPQEIPCLMPAPTTYLHEPTKSAPAGCHCKTVCAAPRIMGRQQPCRRPGGIPGHPAPAASPIPLFGVCSTCREPWRDDRDGKCSCCGIGHEVAP